MSFEEHIRDFGLTQEVNVSAPVVDLTALECTVSKGVVYINKAVVDTMQLDNLTFLEVHVGVQAGAVVFGMRSTKVEGPDTLKPKLLKTKLSLIHIGPLLFRYKLSKSKDYKVDLIDCGEGYLVFAIIDAEAKPKTKTAPFGEVEIIVPGAAETIPDWSEF